MLDGIRSSRYISMPFERHHIWLNSVDITSFPNGFPRSSFPCVHFSEVFLHVLQRVVPISPFRQLLKLAAGSDIFARTNVQYEGRVRRPFAAGGQLRTKDKLLQREKSFRL
jgi:hypothetical protein